MFSQICVICFLYFDLIVTDHTLPCIYCSELNVNLSLSVKLCNFKESFFCYVLCLGSFIHESCCGRCVADWEFVANSSSLAFGGNKIGKDLKIPCLSSKK